MIKRMRALYIALKLTGQLSYDGGAVLSWICFAFWPVFTILFFEHQLNRGFPFFITNEGKLPPVSEIVFLSALLGVVAAMILGLVLGAWLVFKEEVLDSWLDRFNKDMRKKHQVFAEIYNEQLKEPASRGDLEMVEKEER